LSFHKAGKFDAQEGRNGQASLRRKHAGFSHRFLIERQSDISGR